VYGDDRYDYVTVSLADRIPFAAFAEADPTRICVDLYGAVSNSNWITQQLTAQEIKNVDYRQTGKNVMRVIIELRHRQVWGYSVAYRGRSLVITVRRQPARLRLDALTIALDAGHGGSADGAVGGTGTKEKEITLATVRDLQRLLEDDGARVVLTRQSDSSVSMADRYRTAIDAKADLLISVHANSIGSTTDPEAIRGTSTYYRYLCYRPLSRALYGSMLTTGLLPFGNVGGFNFSLNAPTEFPNALVELAFMSHPADEMLLLDGRFRKTLAEKIKDGLEQFLEGCEEP
jgi:N-acetylmuramoyl-L-alanine amidase